MTWLKLSMLLFSFVVVGKALAQEQATDIQTPEQDKPLSIEPEVPEPIAERARKANGILEQRAQREHKTSGDPFVLTPHRPNYFLPITYTHNPNDRKTRQGVEDGDLQSVEFKFQVSMKFPVATGVLGDGSSLWFAYTQNSYWQAYNSDISAPFRDNNYEPEAFVVTKPDWSFFGNKLTYLNFGVNHQSNGQQEPLSRSWNRVFINFLFERENTVVSFKPWYRIPEASDDDDNPDIEDFMGHGELNIVHVVDDVAYDILLRNNLDFSNNRGAVRLGVSFPLWGKVRGYAQYFEGYGQSLLDYNNYTRTLGLGFMLTNWL